MQSGAGTSSQPFSEHIRELRQRLVYSVLALLLGSIVGYSMHERLLHIVRAPLHAQLYYTTPTGGFNAIIKISVMFGIIVSIPVFVYQVGKFLSPAFKHRVKAAKIILSSSVLAILGIAFAYFMSLPAALHFLANIDTNNLQPIITINEYLGFAFAYLTSFALLFQLPLILLFINRIKPQKPGRLMLYQRWVILISFILAAVLTPTPDPINQTIMALPIILLYQFSVILIWLVNRSPKVKARLAQNHKEEENFYRQNTQQQTGQAPLPSFTAYSSSAYSGSTAFPSVMPQASAASQGTDRPLISDVYNTT